MYHDTNTLSTERSNYLSFKKQDESRSRRKRHKKNYNDQKPKSKHSHSKKSKWDAKVNNSYLKNNNYESEYIGSTRLTKHMGFLAKGKISDSISRLEGIVPEQLRARTKQDLHRILELPNGTKTNAPNSDTFPKTSRYRCENISSDDEDSNSGPIVNARLASPVKHFVNGTWTDKLGELSARLTGQKSVFSSEGKASTEHTPQTDNEASICQDVITNKLHSAIATANSLLFPNTCNQTNMRDELISFKRHYESSRKIISSSSNCDSSQDIRNASISDKIATHDFHLNPVLTQDSSPVKQFDNMFPNTNNFTSDSEDEVYIDVQTLLQSKGLVDHNLFDEFGYKQESSSSGNDSSVIFIPSSVSSKGSPIWKPKVSPEKFVPDFIPTPKIYYRQKMF